MSTEPPTGAERVSTLELFFDLVFVFTLTQLTSLLARSLDWRTVWHAVVALGLIFWMYDGYAWLTNAVPAQGGARVGLLLGGMAGYLVLAIAIPDAFRSTGLSFGIAYLLITAIHSFLYIREAGASSSAAIRALAPWNLAGAAIVLVSGALGGATQEAAWTAVFLALWFGTRVGGGYEIEPAHFVERHGLLVIVAIGEAVVSTGLAARGHAVDLTLVAVAVLGLLLSAGFWWTYFGGRAAEAVERAFTGFRAAERPRVAFLGFGYAHYAMLLGVVLTAAGLRQAVSHPAAELPTGHAFALCAGAAIFLLANAWFRAILGLRQLRRSDALVLVMLVAVAPASAVSAFAGLAAAALLLGGLAAAKR
jgi:low temperature requirement protein LtrA